jgi:FkbM family methyltransferase
MVFVSTYLNKLRSLTYFIESPKLFQIRKKGGIPDTFRMLNRPWFNQLGISTVIDIGANTGQFAVTINALLPEARIYSFEPIPECFHQLQKRMGNVKKFTGFNIALGDIHGEIKYEYNSYSPSSSFMPMTDLHKTVYPFARESKVINVKVQTLNSIEDSLNINESLLVKLDVQGYEAKVLRGGDKILRRAKLILIEVCFEELYEQQALFDDIYRILVDWNFEYKGLGEQSYNPLNGKILFADAIFLRRS